MHISSLAGVSSASLARTVSQNTSSQGRIEALQSQIEKLQDRITDIQQSEGDAESKQTQVELIQTQIQQLQLQIQRIQNQQNQTDPAEASIKSAAVAAANAGGKTAPGSILDILA